METASTMMKMKVSSQVSCLKTHPGQYTPANHGYVCVAEGEEEEDEDGEEEDFDEEDDDEEDEEEVEGEDDDEVSGEDEVTNVVFFVVVVELLDQRWNRFWSNPCVLKEEEFGQDGEVDEEDEDEDEDDDGMYSSKMRPRPKTMHTILESYYFIGERCCLGKSEGKRSFTLKFQYQWPTSSRFV